MTSDRRLNETHNKQNTCDSQGNGPKLSFFICGFPQCPCLAADRPRRAVSKPANEGANRVHLPGTGSILRVMAPKRAHPDDEEDGKGKKPRKSSSSSKGGGSGGTGSAVALRCGMCGKIQSQALYIFPSLSLPRIHPACTHVCECCF